MDNKTVYVPVSIEERLPTRETKFAYRIPCLINNEVCLRAYYANNTLDHSQGEISHWLEPTEGILLSKEQWEGVVEALEQCMSRINPNADTWDKIAYLVAKRALESLNQPLPLPQ